MATSFSENEAMTNPYQYNDVPGPKGAYEARQVPGGLYIRVDIPGVPPDGLKLRKYSDTRTVTFTGKAPTFWKNLDSSERVYGGYVVLDRDPLELDITVDVSKGCLRMFFPDAEGSLHSLNAKRANNGDVDDQEIPMTVSELGTWYDGIDLVLNDEAPDKDTRGGEGFCIRKGIKIEKITGPAGGT